MDSFFLFLHDLILFDKLSCFGDVTDFKNQIKQKQKNKNICYVLGKWMEGWADWAMNSTAILNKHWKADSRVCM